MKLNNVWVITGIVLVAAGAWAGRVAWRVHKQWVTLDVRDMPLAQVLHKIERQTWKKIRAESSLDTRITLRVTDKPLAEVLDRIAVQAGARWSTMYAVYGSSKALSSLDSALCTDGKIEPAGWSKIAPNPEDFKPGGKGPAAEHLRLTPDQEKELPPGAHIMPLSDAAAVDLEKLAPGGALEGSGPRAGAAAGEGAGQRRVMIRKLDGGGGGGGQVMFFGSANGGEMTMWSAQELVLESALTNALGSTERLAATEKDAEKTAHKINGRWTSLIAFHKSPLGIGMGGLPGAAPGRGGLGGGPGDENARYANLTPAQRVQRARERQKLKQMPPPNIPGLGN